MVPRPVARGKFRWERLAFFVWWSLNFHKFILFSSVAFLLKGRRGTKQRQGSQGWGRGRRGPPSRPAGLAFVCWGGGGRCRRVDVRKTGTGGERLCPRVGGGHRERVSDICDSLVFSTPPPIPFSDELGSGLQVPESLA